MPEKIQMEPRENPVPLWVKLMWGIFILWGLFYLIAYGLPDLGKWLSAEEPDAVQWKDIKGIDLK